MISYQAFLSRPEFAPWRDHFSQKIAQRSDPKRHGDLESWLRIVKSMPVVTPSSISLNQDTVTFGSSDDLAEAQQLQLRQGLHQLSPWRKGPFNLFGIEIDTEWRSDWKWQRVAPNMSALTKRKVLDVGCGTGYHCWRMLGAGADYVMGIDPSMRFVVQHYALNQYANNQRFDFLPIGVEDLPKRMRFFDSVFSMGVLYHRRDPLNHLLELKDVLRAGGELVLETLIVDKIDELIDGTLQPSERYAQMRNVWSVMTVEKVLALLAEAGFKKPRCVDQNVTSIEEQRQTDWMQYHSLKEFLDPHDSRITIEGYPAPKRGIFIAEK
ncbi:tRNA 5-methoxyuridine(34)/uridine 5-oxyacetic acid(34) synthase CmoB [Arenicella sp.]|nr:tRNA 5-methoxyuridine(34)/uridine 5-oxyacetic acid(34) synthase CmoB [Arenicella sp.]